MNHAKFHSYFKYFLILITAILAEHIYAAELCNNYGFSALKGIPFISCSTAFIILMMCIMPPPKLIFFLCSCFIFSISSLCILPLSHQPIHLYEVYIYIGFYLYWFFCRDCRPAACFHQYGKTTHTSISFE